MARDLPPFRSVTQPELRAFWMKHPHPDVRRLILEVESYLRAMLEIDRLYESIQQAWSAEVGGELVALYMLKRIVFNERMRAAFCKSFVNRSTPSAPR